MECERTKVSVMSSHLQLPTAALRTGKIKHKNKLKQNKTKNIKERLETCVRRLESGGKRKEGNTKVKEARALCCC